jgi:uncharacterized protein
MACSPRSRDEILEQLRWGLDRFDGFVGINNHMGSKFTADTLLKNS